MSAGAELLALDLSKFFNRAHPLSVHCNIKINGVAPGASLVVMSAFPMAGAYV
jgi:hypothetical protein